VTIRGLVASGLTAGAFLAGCERALPPPMPAGASLAPAPALAIDAGRPRPLEPQPAAALGAAGSSHAWTWCNLERANESGFAGAPLVVSRRAPVSFGGWAGVDIQRVSPARLQLRLARVDEPALAWSVDLPVALDRPDVAAARQAPAMARSGFSASLDLSALPPGDYHLLLAYAGGRCDNGRVLRLSD
jgi:hypothetical protein